MRNSNIVRTLVLIATSAIWSGSCCAIGLGESPPPSKIQIVYAVPLSGKESPGKKLKAFTGALNDNDFARINDLFFSCALRGDSLCQFFLADGSAERLDRLNIPQNKKFNQKFVRKWLRKAFESQKAIQFVTLNWDRYYLFGLYGFPRNRNLSSCWGMIATYRNPKDLNKMRHLSKKCKTIERKVYGAKADWLVN